MAETKPATVDGSRSYSFGAEFDRIWLGAPRSDVVPYWHPRACRNVWENEYANWASGFEFSDTQVYCKGASRRMSVFAAVGCLSNFNYSSSAGGLFLFT